MPRSQVLRKTCPRCDRSFETRSPEQRYCSRICAARGPRPNRRRRTIEERACPCGTIFYPSAPTVRFCSRLCVAHYGGRMREKACPLVLQTVPNEKLPPRLLFRALSATGAPGEGDADLRGMRQSVPRVRLAAAVLLTPMRSRGCATTARAPGLQLDGRSNPNEQTERVR